MCFRPKEKFGIDDDMNELKTTPEFKTFVGKKLSEIIDSSLDVINVWESPELLQTNSIDEGMYL